MKDDRLLEMRVFRAVVEAGGFTAASHVLDVSQSFVSQTINNLERRLGVSLLQRSTRVQRLTDEGARFLELSRSMIDGLDEGERAISSPQAQFTGVLRVSAPLAFGLDQIVPRVPSFMARHPQLEVRLALSDLVANLIEENLDVAIRMGRLQDSSLVGYKLCRLARVVVASPGYVAIHGQPQSPDELVRHNCLLWQGPQDHLNRWPFLIDGKPRELEVQGSFRCDNGLTLFQLCTAGLGIMRCAEHLAVPAIRSGTLIELLTDYRWADDMAIHAVVLQSRRNVPRIRAFIDYLTEQFGSPSWE